MYDVVVWESYASVSLGKPIYTLIAAKGKAIKVTRKQNMAKSTDIKH